MKLAGQLAAPLPYRLKNACHGSDGHRLVVAGGEEVQEDGSSIFHHEVLVLQGVGQRWSTSTARLGEPKAFQKGVLVGDYLICMSGRT